MLTDKQIDEMNPFKVSELEGVWDIKHCNICLSLFDINVERGVGGVTSGVIFHLCEKCKTGLKKILYMG